MFKYGSFRLFFIKVIIGISASLFSIVYFLSLYTYNENDKGFKTYTDNSSYQETVNYFGSFGSYLSSYSIIFIGSFSYFIVLFLFIEGIKLLLGIKNSFVFFKFIAIFLSIFLINVSFQQYMSQIYEFGLISTFFHKLLVDFISTYTSNSFLFFLIDIILFSLGLLLLLYAFSIKFTYLKFNLRIFRIFKILKYLKFLLFFLNIFKRRTKSVYFRVKNEPTINNRNRYKENLKRSSLKENSKQLEINEFQFTLPETQLLIKSAIKNSASKEIDRLNKEASIKLQKTLSEYGVDGRITGYRTGPIVTLFEFIPNAGIKSSKIIGLSDDIARAMSSLSARISSQPGKTSLGIEIPNLKRESVLFGDLIEDDRFKHEENSLLLALGKDISGEKVYASLEKMPHLLIAGTTGSGKSVGINAMILSLLFRFKPNECKLILIDPKMLELSIYEDIPHLLTPVVTDPKKAVFALKWVVREMENRYKLMSSLNVKNIQSYNTKVLKTISSGRKLFREVQTGIDSDTRIPIMEKQEIILEKMPFIVVVIDEMADLMMVAGKEVESLVQRLAQMARASGIHLITATQRPSVDVITGTIKANFPSRISYKVASKFDSRTILNEMGAEQLLGGGDMLLLENGANIKRLHGGYVSETEVEKVVTAIKNQATFDYKKEISLQENSGLQNMEGDLVSNNNDELYNDAINIVVKQQKVSTSFIQRYLQIGYNRAARIVEKMEEDGIISEANNAGKRHVLKKN